MGPEHYLISPWFPGSRDRCWQDIPVWSYNPLWDEALATFLVKIVSQFFVIFLLGVASQWVKGVCFVWIGYFLIWDWVDWVFFYTSFDPQAHFVLVHWDIGSQLHGLNPKHLGLQFHQPFCTMQSLVGIIIFASPPLCMIMGAHFIITLASGSSNSVCFIFPDCLTSP